MELQEAKFMTWRIGHHMMISKIISLFEKIGTRRARKELRKMGYTDKRLEATINENLKDWV